EAIPLDSFKAQYASAQATLTLVSLTYTPIGSGRDANPNLATLSYDVTFTTRLLGTFTDPGRTLLLIFEDAPQHWRVAWSAGDIFRELGTGGQLVRSTTPVLRGSIYDRDDRVLADMENPVVTVNVVKRQMPDAALCQTTLTQALSDTAAEVIQARLDAAAIDWSAEIGTLDAQGYTKWEAQLTADCRATFDSRKSRRYRAGSLMPHILGLVGYLTEGEIPAAEAIGFTQESILGRSGIEASQDERLRGVPGARLTIVSSNGTLLREIAVSPPQAAQSVWLTIDSDLQQAVVTAFNQAYSASGSFGGNSKGGAAVVMNVQTGEILALVSYPTYDLNAFTPFPALGRAVAREQLTATQADPRNPLLNRVTQGRYPSGSVMKIATSMAVIDSGVYNVDKRFACSGIWERDGVIKYDWLPGGHGTVTPASAVTQSCNPFFYEVGYQMNMVDTELLPRYLRQMGLGVPTGLTDIEEDPGYIGDAETLRTKYGAAWSFSDAALMAIGQGEVEITPLQIVRLTAAIANGGTLYQPQLVLRAGILDDVRYTAQPDALSDINMSAEALAMVIEGMCGVTIDYSGTATYAFEGSPLLDLGVCGKTGTAQDLPRPSTHAWFTAYAPRDNPEIAVTVVVENAGEGSGVAAPLVRRIMEYYFYDIVPDAALTASQQG
ncbi:MAG: hypothetical protein H7Y11_05505, partial [Armatimonadetes bacterium]|nr:hypothetical protein [Anaerolineae bacterium]